MHIQWFQLDPLHGYHAVQARSATTIKPPQKPSTNRSMKKTPKNILSAASAAASILAVCATSQAAVTVTGDVIGSTSDAVALNQGTGGAATPFNLSVGSASEDATSLWVGRYDNGTDAPGGSNAAAIFPFLLPDLGTLSPDMPDPFTNATFTFTTLTTKGWNATLQGLDVRASSDVLAEDFRFGGGNGATEETNLQTNILTGSSAVGTYTSIDISSFLNDQYDGGANAGKYVFLRLHISTFANQNIFNNTNTGFRITSANAGSDQPSLSYIASVPEPSSIALLGLGLSSFLLRRRR